MGIIWQGLKRNEWVNPWKFIFFKAYKDFWMFKEYAPSWCLQIGPVFISKSKEEE